MGARPGPIEAVSRPSRAAVPSPEIDHAGSAVHVKHIGYGSTVHWHETHGDYLLEREGYTRHMPAGYCEKHDQKHDGARRQLTAQVNDVRYAADTSMSYDTHASSGQPSLRLPDGVRRGE